MKYTYSLAVLFLTIISLNFAAFQPSAAQVQSAQMQTTTAQEPSDYELLPKFAGGLSLAYAIPQGAWSGRADNGFHFALHLAYTLTPWISLGIEGGLRSLNGSAYYFNDAFRLGKNLSLLYANAFVRLQPELWVVRPYLDIFAGVHGVNSDLSTERQVVQIDRNNNRTTSWQNVKTYAKEDNSVLGYGAGAGIAVRIGPIYRSHSVLSLGAKYMLAGDVKYIPTQEVRVANSLLYYTTETSPANLLSLQFMWQVKF